MACPKILALGQVFLVLIGVQICGAGSVGDEKRVVFECAHLQPIRDKFSGLFRFSTMLQFFWQDDLVRVSLGESMDVMLMLTLTIRVEHLISPRCLEKV
jgi:hypothetical protein